MLEPTIGLEPMTADYELLADPAAAGRKCIAAKDFNKFPPARKGVLATLITLALGERG